jgi:hypothetical protein
MAFKQAERKPVDGGITMRRGVGGEADGTFVVSVTHDGQPQTIVMTAYNAARVFATLGVMLASADGLDDTLALLSKTAQREIKL